MIKSLQHRRPALSVNQAGTSDLGNCAYNDFPQDPLNFITSS
jgi:hypothetical protein